MSNKLLEQYYEQSSMSVTMDSFDEPKKEDNIIFCYSDGYQQTGTGRFERVDCDASPYVGDGCCDCCFGLVNFIGCVICCSLLPDSWGLNLIDIVGNAICDSCSDICLGCYDKVYDTICNCKCQ